MTHRLALAIVLLVPVPIGCSSSYLAPPAPAEDAPPAPAEDASIPEPPIATCAGGFERRGDACVGWVPATRDDSSCLGPSRRLDDGRVVAVGRCTDGERLTGAGVYDPLARVWSISDHAVVRSGAAAVVAGSRAWAFGGFGREEILSETLSLDRDGWNSAAPLPSARARHSATLLRDGRILIAGGLEDLERATRTTALYNPRTDRWTSASPMSESRSGHSATLLDDGSVLLLGGDVDPPWVNGPRVTTGERYEPRTDRWRPIRVPGMLLAGHSATLLGDGRLLVVNGSGVGDGARDAHLYDSTRDAWSITAPMRRAQRTRHGAGRIADGRVLVVGGSAWSGTSAAEMFDPIAGIWTDLPSPTRWYNFLGDRVAIVPLADGQVLVGGAERYVEMPAL